MSVASGRLQRHPRPAASVALRLALRELRGGLRGFSIFIACIALGVMAIAGVGSFARSLTDGLAREGRVILGGDLAFSLIHREATPAERALPRRPRHGVLGRDHARDGAHRRRPAGAGRDQGGRRRLSAVRRAGARSRHAAVAKRSRSATARSARPSIASLLARLDLKPGARLTIGSATIEIAAVIKSEPDKLASGIAFGPRADHQRGRAARDRPAAARQPGALALPAAGAATAATARSPPSPRRPPSSCRTPAGKSAPAPTPRRSSSATSSASPSF